MTNVELQHSPETDSDSYGELALGAEFRDLPLFGVRLVDHVRTQLTVRGVTEAGRRGPGNSRLTHSPVSRLLPPLSEGEFLSGESRPSSDRSQSLAPSHLKAQGLSSDRFTTILAVRATNTMEPYRVPRRSVAVVDRALSIRLV